MLNHITSLQLSKHCKSYMSIGQAEMSNGHSNVHSSFDERKRLFDIQMPLRPLDEQKCPMHIRMSIRPLDEQKCPLDIQMSIRPLDEWTLSDGKHSTLLSTWGHAQSYYVFAPSLAL